MEWLRSHRGWLTVAGGFALPLVLAAVLVPVRDSFADAAAALVLVAGVALVATTGSRAGGYVAAASAALWFDFFLTRPYEQLTITHRQDIEIAVSLLVVGIVVTEMAAQQLVAEVSKHLVELLHLRDCRFESGASFTPMLSLSHDGVVHSGRFDFPVERWGLPGRQLELRVCSRGRVVGRFLMSPTTGVPVSVRRRLVAVALADQVGSHTTLRLRVAGSG